MATIQKQFRRLDIPDEDGDWTEQQREDGKIVLRKIEEIPSRYKDTDLENSYKKYIETTGNGALDFKEWKKGKTTPMEEIGYWFKALFKDGKINWEFFGGKAKDSELVEKLKEEAGKIQNKGNL